METNPKKAREHLSKDPVMAKLIKKHKDISHRFSNENPFEGLVADIINQQLSDKASATIYKRFISVIGRKPLTPKSVLRISDAELRECGISFSKISYIKGVAKAVEKGELDFSKLEKLEDESVLKELVKLKGVGEWTAEMFLMFTLGRPDVFSMGDIGLRNAISRLYKIDRDDYEKIRKISDKWSPYRSIACRYLWKSLV